MGATYRLILGEKMRLWHVKSELSSLIPLVVDEWIDEAAVTVDTDARHELYRKVQVALMRDLPVYPLNWDNTWFIYNKKVQNMHVDLFNAQKYSVGCRHFLARLTHHPLSHV